MVATAERASKAVLSVILAARNSSQARNPTHRPLFTALTCVLCCQLPASIGPCVVPAFGCVIPPESFMVLPVPTLELQTLRIYGPEDLHPLPASTTMTDTQPQPVSTVPAAVVCSGPVRQRDPAIFSGTDDTGVEDWLASYECLKTKGCMEVVQATKLRAIGASDQEQAGKFVNGQRVSLSTASFFWGRLQLAGVGEWRDHGFPSICKDIPARG
ncbi:uncharacterized protein LOC144093669 [Amblyomma americanum]